ncbi:MAG: VWA domain-containing protein, partial [Methanobacteriota archaeon]
VPARRGGFDFGGPAGRCHGLGAVWFVLRRGRRRASRAELFVLWDVSGSMRDHDGELFALVYALLRTSRRTRVFAFSTGLAEVTDLVRARPYARARQVASRALGPASGGTRIGRCLRDFRRAHGARLHPWATLVILSDGWDLGDIDLLAAELEWLRRRVRRIVWVNPYGSTPGFEPATAGMQGALPYLDALLGPDDLASAGTSRAPPARMLEKSFIRTS